MTPKATQSSRVPTAKPRSAGGVLGGALGIISMSVIAGVLVTAAVTPVVALTGAAATSAVSIFENLPGNLKPTQLAQPTQLFAKQGDELVKFAEFYDQDRDPVESENISQYVKDAVVAIEDPRFYTHGGVDALAAARAVAQNAFKSGDTSGASTVTMQYVRNVLIQEATAIPDEKEQEKAYKNAMRQDMDRKLKEMKLAIGVEKKFTKDEILTGYLNIALFGRKVYGIESAARYYYGISAKDLSLSQAASLVAIVNRPVTYQIDIPENLEANKQRRDLILNKMFQHGKITAEQRDEALATPVEPNITPRVQGCAVAEENYGLGHYCDFVQRQLKKDSEFGADPVTREFNVRRGGYDIVTTIDLDLQRAAVEAVRSEVPQTMEGIDVGGATVSTEVKTGRILAMAQNRPFSTDETLGQGYTAINYSTDFEDGGSSGFQVGSTFKSITLAEWIRSGRSVRDVVNVDGRTVQLQSFKASCMPGGVYGYGPWKFGNDNLGVRGNQSVLTAISQSLNGGLVSMQQKMDLCDTFALAKKMGLHRASKATDQNFASNLGTYDLTMNPSNTFGGTDEISPLTMSTAYGAFAGAGTVCTPTAIDSITGLDGKPVPFQKAKCSEAMSPEVAAGVAYALQYTVTNGIARHARSDYGVPHLAKTGTTDLYKDNWTVGASSRVSTATWVGNAGPFCYSEGNCERVDTRNFGGYQGLTAADSRIWPAVMRAADLKYGGEGFGDPAATTLKQTMVAVPNVKGMSYEDAATALTNAGFEVTDGGEVDSAVPKDMIARSDPEAGTEAGAGTVVTLYRSLGNAGTIPDDLIDQPAGTAQNILRSLGFSSIETSCETNKGVFDATKSRVRAVSPDPGSEVRLNTKVSLTVSCS